MAFAIASYGGGRRSAIGQRPDEHHGYMRSMPRPRAAMETRPPGNPPPSAARAAGGEGSAADWDRARSPCDRDAKWHGRAAGLRWQGQGRAAAIPKPAAP